MRTKEHRDTHKWVGGRCPRDLSDEEWAVVEPVIPPASPGGRPRKADMRQAMNTVLYLLRTDRPWRYLPGDGFPPRTKIYDIWDYLLEPV